MEIISPDTSASKLLASFRTTRSKTEDICAPLEIEDYVVQPVMHVSPPKWHLAHSTWFFEQFILRPNLGDYEPYRSEYPYIFNSYYESVGDSMMRARRGNLSRPTVEEIYSYRKYVDRHMVAFLENDPTEHQQSLVAIGLNHEQQHQELLRTDIKYIFGHNLLFPQYGSVDEPQSSDRPMGFIDMEEGVYEIGYDGGGFCYDNEKPRHKAYLHSYRIADRLVTNREYIEFIEDGGYDQFDLWHKDGRQWVQENDVSSPLYWYEQDGEWYHYTLDGYQKINSHEPLKHVSYYEAYAFAQWRGMRLPTEFEWEAAQDQFHWGDRWECTESSYLPYPGYQKPKGAIGEYNGKFMVNQKVFRGASVATPEGHERPTYRNYFHPNYRWQFTGIRLAK